VRNEAPAAAEVAGESRREQQLPASRSSLKARRDSARPGS